MSYGFNMANKHFVNTMMRKRIFDEIWSMKKNDNKTDEQIYDFLYSKVGDHPRHYKMIQLADQTQKCKDIVDKFSQDKDVMYSTEFHADKNVIMLLDLIPNINDYFTMIYACDFALERNNLGTVVLNNKINFIVTDVKSIVDDPSILDRFFEHKITEDMFRAVRILFGTPFTR